MGMVFDLFERGRQILTLGRTGRAYQTDDGLAVATHNEVVAIFELAAEIRQPRERVSDLADGV